jgi:four helix bundle protein
MSSYPVDFKRYTHRSQRYSRSKEDIVKGDNIADRLLDFAVACLRLAAELESNPVGKHIARQLTRSSTSGGAHYEEARSAESAADFAHKIAVAGKEVGESVYWLKITKRAAVTATLDIERWIDEGLQLVRILAASVRTARSQNVAVGAIGTGP